MYTNEKLQYKNGVKMVYMSSDVPENLDITGFEKHLGRVITYTRTHLMSGIRLAKNKMRLCRRCRHFCFITRCLLAR